MARPVLPGVKGCTVIYCVEVYGLPFFSICLFNYAQVRGNSTFKLEAALHQEHAFGENVCEHNNLYIPTTNALNG